MSSMRPFSRSSRDLSFFVELQCDEVGLSLAFRRDFDGSVTFGVESVQDYLLNKSSKKKHCSTVDFQGKKSYPVFVYYFWKYKWVARKWKALFKAITIKLRLFAYILKCLLKCWQKYFGYGGYSRTMRWHWCNDTTVILWNTLFCCI